MNAQIPTAVIQQNIALDLLFPSPTNPRKRFDEAKLKELAASIETQGVLQPILVRTWQVGMQLPAGKVFGDMVGTYEVIAGERRYRASKLAGLAEVPCFVRELSNLQVLHAQVIENLQRDDLHPIEEAEGYGKLMEQTDDNGDKFTADTIAAEVGKSRAYVYGRLKLLDLCQEARDAFFAGKLDASTALLIARIPVHKLQIEALKEVTATMTHDWIGQGKAEGDKMLSYRAAKAILQDRYMLDLADAPFDTKDAELTPKAGSCTECTKRTGNQPDIFDDVGSKDVCTDPVCHATKKTAHVLALQKKYEEKGDKLLVGKEAKKIIPANYMNTTDDCLKDHGLVKLEARVPGDDQNRTWKQLLKEKKILDNKGADKPSVAKTFIENPRNTGEIIETISIEEATKKLREIAGYEVVIKPVSSKQDNDAKQAKEREKAKQELAIENAFRGRLFDTLHARIEADMLDPSSGTFPKLYRMLAEHLWNDTNLDNDDAIALMRKYTTLPSAEEGKEIDWRKCFEEFRDTTLPNLTPAQHLMLIIELPLISFEITAGTWSGKPQAMLEMADELSIDAESMRKEVAADHKAAAAAAKKAEKPAAKKPAGKAKKTEAASPTLPAMLAETAAPKVRPAATWPFPTPI